MEAPLRFFQNWPAVAQALAGRLGGAGAGRRCDDMGVVAPWWPQVAAVWAAGECGGMALAGRRWRGEGLAAVRPRGVGAGECCGMGEGGGLMAASGGVVAMRGSVVRGLMAGGNAILVSWANC